MQKAIQSIHKAHEPHMVGDGLLVRNFFSYGDPGRNQLSPFLMLDYGSPVEFPPTNKLLGVGMHPHRGFETVTFVFQGGLDHRDTAGNRGTISAGDVQWMTAGSGVLHEELHSAEFRRSGGTLQMLQLWVNLPSRFKMTPPKYQTLLKADIPVATLGEGKANLRVIAGSLGELNGPAQTFTPLNLWELHVTPGGKVKLDVPDGYTTALLLMNGSFVFGQDLTDSMIESQSGTSVHAEERLNESTSVETNVARRTDTVSGETLVILTRQGTDFIIESATGAHIMVLNGQPIEEPVVGHGPFVMNTKQEIIEAFDDFQKGRLDAVSGGR